ncbi:hypothetical protein GXW74_15665 [Roseomonas eburnea]|uniref:Uncharacterized protein n=1 Tax=Neoroseomonas eburnea TaxID=1346889 RepID=A0A9X9XDZ6_9PROT|nr:hypothetical protein [Neoroseomonas eburnea]MBR0681932.1 hypothetical protein [Neoroseomonas eburnea]
MIAMALYAAWCGALWRVRGGAWETLLHLPPGTTTARLATAVIMTLPLLPAFGLPAAAIAPALYLGMVLAGWGDAMDIGRRAGSRWGDAIVMSAWGVVAILPGALVAGALGGQAWPLFVAGVLFGPSYAFTWWWGDMERLPQPRLRGFASGPTEWAEVACGALLGAALWVALP